METSNAQKMSRKEYERYLQTSRRGKKRRKRRRSLIAPVLLVLVLLTCLILALAFFFRVDQVTIRANGLAENAAVIKASGIEKGDNLLLMKTDAAAEKIYALNPLIDRCEIAKKYPSSVEITLTKGTTAYQIETGTGYYNVSSRGRILSAAEKSDPACPVLRGVPVEGYKVGDFIAADEAHFALAVKVLAAMKAEKLNAAALVDVRDLYDINVLYDGHVRLIFGNESNLETKMASMAKTYLAEFSKDEYGSIDGSVALYRTGVRKGAEQIKFFTETEEKSDGTVSGESSGSGTEKEESSEAKAEVSSDSGAAAESGGTTDAQSSGAAA